MIHIKQFTFGLFQEHCFLAWDNEKNCAIIDPGAESDNEREELSNFIKANDLRITAILLTHAHFDHIYGLADCIEKFNAPVYMSSKEENTLNANDFLCKQFHLAPPLKPINTIDISEGDIITVGSLEFEVISTPGHTIGGVSYLEKKEKTLFSGDSLFAGAIGRSDFPGGDYDQLMESIMIKLMALDGDINVYPGHGPSTDIATERTTNPFLFPFNEPYEDPEEKGMEDMKEE